MMVKFVVLSISLFTLTLIMQYFLNEAITSADEALHSAKLQGLNAHNSTELLHNSYAYEGLAV